jgi:hypothetical protein
MTEAQQRVQKAMEEVHFNERMEKIIAEDDKQD